MHSTPVPLWGSYWFSVGFAGIWFAPSHWAGTIEIDLENLESPQWELRARQFVQQWQPADKETVAEPEEHEASGLQISEEVCLASITQARHTSSVPVWWADMDMVTLTSAGSPNV